VLINVGKQNSRVVEKEKNMKDVDIKNLKFVERYIFIGVKKKHEVHRKGKR
jgi:hypothetical protein